MNHIVAIEGFPDENHTFALLNEARYLLAAQEIPPQFTTVSDIPHARVQGRARQGE